MNNDIGILRSISPSVAPTEPGSRVARVTRVEEVHGVQRKQEAERTRDADESLDKVVTDLNQMVQDLHRELRFSVDKESGDTVIKVVNRATDEVVRQIPSEDVMHLRKRLEEAAGIFFDGSA